MHLVDGVVPASEKDIHLKAFQPFDLQQVHTLVAFFKYQLHWLRIIVHHRISFIISFSGVNPCGRRHAVSHQWPAAAKGPACPGLPQPSPLQTQRTSPVWCKSSYDLYFSYTLLVFMHDLCSNCAIFTLFGTAVWSIPSQYNTSALNSTINL